MKLPSRGKAKPKVATPDDRMTLTEHLAELRTRIIRSLLAIVLGIIVIMAFYDHVLRFILRPYKNLCAEKGPDFCTANLVSLGPLDGFTTRLSISTYGGILLALPVLLWQIWRFIVPALHAKEKKYAIPFVFSSVLLFALGGAIAYWTLDKALEFLIAWSGDDVVAVYPVSKYVSLVGLMVAAFGIGFEFPVLLVFLQLVGVLTPETLIKGWRYAILAIFVIAAVITPSGDPYSMMALAGPMTVFYIISILIGKVFQRRKRAAEAAAGQWDDADVRVDRAELTGHYDFPLDAFQLRAIDAIDDGRSVLVAAPTGSGKTVVAEYAIEAARRAGKRAFYTAPIKALSNQKYHDLVARYGADGVGLLTGDNAINGDAPVVVMTTEVLRNMIYARSGALDHLAVAILDEVHFLQDTYRGPVWEEVIIHLPAYVKLVCLSATVSNADELTEWISTVRGPTTAVVEDRRPVRLENLYFVGDRTHDRTHLMPVLVNGRPNHDAMRIDAEAARSGKPRQRKQTQGRRRLYTPSRLDVVETLERASMLPAIVFIFSRNQCDEAARVCLAAGMRLTTGEERDRIREIVDARLANIEPADLAVLGYSQFLAQLEAGVAAHHAGMVPPFKEVVESCFAQGLIKVVFATETLAVGINMPARCVVIEKLTKFTGDHHAFLTPGEYTQLTGRAGRRGIDDLGHAMVLWSPFVPFDQVAALASSRSFHLNSAFRTTYNMTANLVRSYTSERAHHLLNLSFAQFQADRDVVKIEARLERRQTYLHDLRETATSPFGDLEEYRRLLLGEERPRRQATIGRDNPIELALLKLKPGDVIYVEKGKYAGRAAVLATAHRKGSIRVTALTVRRESLHLDELDFDDPPRTLAKLELPVGFTPGRNDHHKEIVRRLDRVELVAPGRSSGRPQPGDHVGHPVEDDPDLKERLVAAAQAERVGREVDELRQRITGRSQTISRDFDRVLRILTDWGYLSGWSLTEAGEILARTFHECDLLIVECLRQGLLDGLEPAALAGLVSVFVYEHRTADAPPTPWFPSAAVKQRWQRILAVSHELAGVEEQAGLPVHRQPDPTFVAIAFAWAAGEGFADVVEAEELSGGDFVRTTKQLIDLLRQLALVAPQRATRAAAEQASERLFRGVVAASSAVEADEEVEHIVADELTDGDVIDDRDPDPDDDLDDHPDRDRDPDRDPDDDPDDDPQG